MNFLFENAPTIDHALDLEVHELAYLVLRLMQTASKPKHAGNWLLELTRTYDPPLHSRVQQPHRRDELELRLAEAIEWLTRRGLVARLYEANYVHLFVTRRGLAIDTTEDFGLLLRECDLSPALLHPIVRREAWPPVSARQG
jgi:hypothetical protein